MHNSGFISSRNGSGQVKKERKKIIVPTFPTQLRIEKKKKKIKKLKSTIQASFQAKTGQDRSRMREKKKIIVPILPTRPRIENSKKNSKKIQKIKNHHLGFN